MTKKLGKSHSKVFFRNILPTTFIDKNTGYYKYGYNDNLPLDIIQAINNSGTAKKALKKYADYIQADGFITPQASTFKVNEKETADKILSKIALSFGYFSGVAIHVSRLGNGTVGRIKVMPFHKVRRSDDCFYYNDTIGSEKYDKNAWVKLQSFKGTIASFSDMEINKTQFDSRGEIYYVYDGNEFDSAIYPIPDFLASFEDLKTSSEISKMDYESVLNGFVFGGTMTFIGVSEDKDDTNQSDRDRIEESMVQFTGLKKNNDGLTSRFAVMTNFVETKEEVPVFTGNDPKPILEASNSKRDVIERAVCRLWDVHPVLLGYSEAAVLGNQDAIEQAKTILRDAVNPIQRMISDAFKELYGNSIDWTISEFGVEINIPTAGDKILKTLNSLSPLLATKVIDLIPENTLLEALGIPNKPIEQTPPQP